MLDVCLLGTGGMMPLPRRYLTALMTRFNGSNLLIDCGEATQLAIKEKGWGVKNIDTICFTHFHADHISGLPGLLLDMKNSDREEPVTIIGPKNVEYIVKSLLVIAPELPFEIRFLEISGDRSLFSLNGYEIAAFRVQHNVLCYGYSLSIPRAGAFDVEAAKGYGLPVQYWNKLQKGEQVEFEGKTYTPDMVMGPPRRGIKLTYCTDTRPTNEIAQEAAGADLFICEGMYADPEKAQKAKQYKHMTFTEAAKLALAADPGELWLTHYSPSLTNPRQYFADVKTIFPRAKLGKDGKSTTLEFIDEEG